MRSEPFRSGRCWILALGMFLYSSAVAEAGFVGKIVSPPGGLHLSKGSDVSVVIDVYGESNESEVPWHLELLNSTGIAQLLASGNGSTRFQSVGDVKSDKLDAGVYTLRLIVGPSGREVTASQTIRLVDSHFALIPMYAGDFRRPSWGGLTADSAVSRIAVGAPYDPQGDEMYFILDRLTGKRVPLPSKVGGSLAIQLSGDGSRFFFLGTFDRQLGLGFTEITTGDTRFIMPQAGAYSSIDFSGNRGAVQAKDPSNPDPLSKQYYSFDVETGAVLRITDAPDSIITEGAICPSTTATRPLITGDGKRIFVITESGLGIAVRRPGSCNVFEYTIDTQTWRLVKELSPQITHVFGPALSANGEWLSFTTVRLGTAGTDQGFPTLLNTDSAELFDPVGPPSDYGVFDAVITREAGSVVVSTRADLDPNVGNEDHNLELFLYDRTQGTYEQITDTVGGVGSASTGCPPYFPIVSQDGSVAVFGLPIFSVEGCSLDGPQIVRETGLIMGAVRAVRKRPANRSPIWSPPRTIRVRAGEAIELTLSASDPDGDPLSFFAQSLSSGDIPVGAEFDDNHDGTAKFVWHTTTNEIGTTSIRAAVFDEGGGLQIADLSVAICTEVVEDSSVIGVLRGIFEADPPPICRSADLNGDGRITAADLLALIGWTNITTS